MNTKICQVREKMIIEKPGFVTERILFLGRKESCVYLLKGSEEFALLGGGLTYIVPILYNN